MNNKDILILWFWTLIDYTQKYFKGDDSSLLSNLNNKSTLCYSTTTNYI